MADGRRSLEREGLAFFGAMGAGLSHELSNVFNIINELSGLQRDIIRSASDGGSAGLARVADLAERIASQVARGEEINRNLHRLSHSVDDPNVVFDLGEWLAFFGALAARAARLAEVRLRVRPPGQSIAMSGDPFALLLALDACLRTVLASATEAREVDVSAEAGAGGVCVIISSGDPIPDPAGGDAAALELGCAILGAEASLDRSQAPGQRLVLQFAGAGAGDGVDRHGNAEG
jgi:hypothetical protein